jgi:hypothetical protein
MDPATAGVLAATVVPLASGLAGEAGRQAWNSLVATVRARFGREVAPTAGEASIDRADAEALAAELMHLAEQDAEFSEWLGTWIRSASSIGGNPTVTNTVGDRANVSGGLVQAHTVTGNVTFGSPTAPEPNSQ